MEQLNLLIEEAVDAHTITTREGSIVDISGEQWHLPYSSRSSTMNFARLPSKPFKYALKHYVSHKIIRTSTHAGLAVFDDVLREIIPHTSNENISNAADEEELIEAFEVSINMAKKEHRLWALYRSIEWYKWSAKNYPELGFSKSYAIQLTGMSVPANPKGQASYGRCPPKI